MSLNLKATFLLLFFWTNPVDPPATLLLGTVQDCSDTESYGVRGVHVYAFDASTSPEITALLSSIDTITFTGDDVEGMSGLRAQYDRLTALVNHTPKLGSATSNGNGDFEIRVPKLDSVTLLAEGESDDQSEYYFAHKSVSVKGQPDVRVTISMTPECQPAASLAWYPLRVGTEQSVRESHLVHKVKPEDQTHGARELAEGMILQRLRPALRARFDSLPRDSAGLGSLGEQFG